MARPNLRLPLRFVTWLAPFLAAFSRRTRPTTAALAIGAVLAVGPRTVTNCLRALGLAEHSGVAAFHRVLNRNAWSGLPLARVLVRMVVTALVPSGLVIIGVDHTLEHRLGPRIGLAGRFYDPSLRGAGPGWLAWRPGVEDPPETGSRQNASAPCAAVPTSNRSTAKLSSISHSWRSGSAWQIA